MSDHSSSEGDPNREPCAACSEETAEGSPLYYDRYTGREEDGTRCYLCLDCVSRLRAAGDERLTEKDGALVYLAGMQLTMPTIH